MADVLHTLFSNTCSEWKLMYRMVHFMAWRTSVPMGLLPNTLNCACAGNAGNVFPTTALSIPTCITARAWRTCRDVCQDRQLAVSFEVGGGKKRSRQSWQPATRIFTYLVRGSSGCYIYIRPPQQSAISSWWLLLLFGFHGHPVYLDLHIWAFCN